MEVVEGEGGIGWGGRVTDTNDDVAIPWALIDDSLQHLQGIRRQRSGAIVGWVLRKLRRIDR